MSKFKFSVIIPTLNTNSFLLKNLSYLNQQSFKDFEVIIVSENKIENIFQKDYFFKLRIILKNITKPGKKRNYAASISDGEYLCFIDDDAFPANNWLEEANNFFDKNMLSEKVLLGGPGILPDDDNFFSKCANLFFCSIFTGVSKSKYLAHKSYEKIDFDDWPSVNMAINKKSFLELKGFDDNFWPGEDSKLCMKLIESSGKIFYRSSFQVFHYRRSNFKKHFRQIFRYSYTRGLFFQNSDTNSKKIIYTTPTLFMLYFLSLPIASINVIYLIPLMIFFLLLIIDAFLSTKIEKNFMVIISSRLLIFMSLICYGFGFLLSFLNKKIYLGLGR